jgi:hypothetical protein
MLPMKVLVICTGDEEPSIFARPHHGVFTCEGVLHTVTTPAAGHPSWSDEALAFAGCTGLYLDIVSVASSMGFGDFFYPKNPTPSLVVITEDQNCGAEPRPLKDTLQPLFGSKRWQHFAVRNGVLCCLYTTNPDSLGLSGSEMRSQELLSLGIDFMVDASRSSESMETKEQWATRIRAEAYREFRLLYRQAKWSLDLQRYNWGYALLVFFLFGVVTACGQEIVSRIASKLFPGETRHAGASVERDIDSKRVEALPAATRLSASKGSVGDTDAAPVAPAPPSGTADSSAIIDAPN